MMSRYPTKTYDMCNACPSSHGRGFCLAGENLTSSTEVSKLARYTVPTASHAFGGGGGTTIWAAARLADLNTNY